MDIEARRVVNNLTFRVIVQGGSYATQVKVDDGNYQTMEFAAERKVAVDRMNAFCDKKELETKQGYPVIDARSNI